jgi:hypothetical protein
MQIIKEDKILHAVVIAEQKVFDITSSISLRSLLNRLTILPRGTLLKNLLSVA